MHIDHCWKTPLAVVIDGDRLSVRDAVQRLMRDLSGLKTVVWEDGTTTHALAFYGDKGGVQLYCQNNGRLLLSASVVN